MRTRVGHIALSKPQHTAGGGVAQAAPVLSRSTVSAAVLLGEHMANNRREFAVPAWALRVINRSVDPLRCDSQRPGVSNLRSRVVMSVGGRYVQICLIRTTEAGYTSVSRTGPAGQESTMRGAIRRVVLIVRSRQIACCEIQIRESTSSLLGQHPSVSNAIGNGSVIPPHTL